MINIPTIKIELENLKQSVQHCFVDYNNELNDLIIETLNDRLTESWVREEINKVVTKCLKSAIANIAGNYQLEKALSDLIAKSVADLCEVKNGNQ